MSRYQALTAHLKRQPLSEVAMTFEEIEKLLQAPLPLSARRHRPWWSNNEAGNSAVRAWRRAGRKTARVDMAGEKVVFVRDDALHAVENSGEAAPLSPLIGDAPLALSPVAESMISKEMARRGVDRASAIVAILNQEAIERRMRALQALRASLPKLDLTMDEIVEMIREDRESH